MDWCLALGVKTFPAGFSTTNKLLFVRRSGEEVMWGCIGREGIEWQLLTSEVFISHSNFLVHTDGLWYCCWSVYHVLDSLLGCKCLQAICGLMGSCIHPADIWLSVIIASLLPESLSDPPWSPLNALLWRTKTSGRWYEKQSQFLALASLGKIY